MNTTAMPSDSTERPLVLITGSSGLIGSRLTSALNQRYRVVGLDVEQPVDDELETNWLNCDLTDARAIRATLSQVAGRYGDNFASVIHLAGYYDDSGKPNPLYRDLTVEGTRHLIQALQRFNVEQFVFSSSLLVMKPAEDHQPIRSDSPVDADWEYPRSKLAAENVILVERGDIPTVLLRIAGVYDEKCHALPIAQQIHRIYTKQLASYVFPGDQTNGQAFVHLNDLVACIECVIERRAELEPCVTFLVGEEDVMSYGELQEKLGLLIHGEVWPTLRIPKVVAKVGAWIKKKMATDEASAPVVQPWMVDLADQDYPIDIRRTRQLLGWEPKYKLRTTLAAIVAKLHNDPRGWYECNQLPVPSMVAQQKNDADRVHRS